MKNDNKKRNKGITLIALVVTIAVLLILAGITISEVFSDEGLWDKSNEFAERVNATIEENSEQINSMINELDEMINSKEQNKEEETTTGGEEEITPITPKISTLIGTVVDKNTKAEDAYGNKITIPKGFKILAHGTAADSATYTYSGDGIPAVQDGIVIENGTDGNQFVWVPVGTINNKDNTTNTITLGRYEFNGEAGVIDFNTPTQSAENYTQEVIISLSFKELITFRMGNFTRDSTAKNTTAKNLAEFISTTLANGGYYIARFEAGGTTRQITSKYNQTVLTEITQVSAASVAARDTTDYASDLVNSYAWDTAIIFIQTYSIEEDASNYAYVNNSTSLANTGINNDKYCNIWDMSGNVEEWTTEYSTYYNDDTGYFYPCVKRGGFYFGSYANNDTSYRRVSYTDRFSDGDTTVGKTTGFRILLYVK